MEQRTRLRVPPARRRLWRRVSAYLNLDQAGFADPSVGLRFMFEIGTRGDGKTGKPRTVINIEKAAKLSTVDRQRSGLGFDKVEQTPRSAPPSPETEAA